MSDDNFTKGLVDVNLEQETQSFFGYLNAEYLSIAFSYVDLMLWPTVNKSLSMAAYAGLRVLELRGTSYTIETTFTPDPTSPTGSVPLKEEKVINYAATSSFKTFVFFLTALCAGKMGIAKRLALLVWDPPDADYIDDYASCTKYDQATAFAVKAIVEGNTHEAIQKLDKVPPLKPKKDGMTDHVDTSLCRDLLMGIAKHDPELFLIGLHKLLEGHDSHHRKKRNRSTSYFNISLAATGLSLWAVQLGLINKTRLPEDSHYLPLGLLNYSLEHLSDDSTVKFEPMEFAPD